MIKSWQLLYRDIQPEQVRIRFYRFKKKERKSPIQLIHRASKRTFPCLWPRSRKRNFPADSINSLIAFPPNKSQPGHPEDLSRELSLSLPAATMPFSRGRDIEQTLDPQPANLSLIFHPLGADRRGKRFSPRAVVQADTRRPRRGRNFSAFLITRASLNSSSRPRSTFTPGRLEFPYRSTRTNSRLSRPILFQSTIRERLDNSTVCI